MGRPERFRCVSDEVCRNPGPKVTVLLPVFNAARHLRAALDSVLGQTFRDFELLVIDDGSCDGSAAIVESADDPRIRLVHNEVNLGIVASLNRGLELARGIYVARHDADDISLPHRFALQVAVLDASPEVAVVGAWLQTIDAEDRPTGTWRYPSDLLRLRWAHLFDSAIAHSSAVFRTEAVRRAGGYSPAALHAEDFDLWSRLAADWQLTNVPEVLVRYRIHDAAVSVTRRDEQARMRCRIAGRNQRAILGDAFDEVSCALLASGRVCADAGEALTALAQLRLLRDAFVERTHASAEVRRALSRDHVQRMSRLLQPLAAGERWRCVRARARDYPIGHWLTGRFLWDLLGARNKAALRRIVGRRR